ncbi:hypothetical protein BKA67DRAFT_570246 [Truncatella angustata]|uniref:Uncharacterized protein n=1 Tax=Truncatella angustata TaxID=152316 RepID=A0A9P8UK38_9PEZI|nr:uncharacterized protein BKA67DRAFT_570246 [Truncatella angustata]KAH6653549.1 hypothetical protein BKA67DRAFT_570246 [Truncatella angustata]
MLGAHRGNPHDCICWLTRPYRMPIETANHNNFQSLKILESRSDLRLEVATNDRAMGSDAGWEVMLSHNMRNGTTIGFCKATRWQNGTTPECLDKSIETLLQGRLSPGQLCHPMLLPIIIFSHEIDDNIEEKQKEAVDNLEELTRAIDKFWRRKLVRHGELTGEEIATFHGELVACHDKVLWKRPARYLEVLNEMHDALLTLYAGYDADRKHFLDSAYIELLARVTFYQSQLKALKASADRTAAKLKTQRELLQALISLDVSRHQEKQQKRDREDSDRVAAGQTLIALLGIFFLPASLVAGILSTTFFDFRDPVILSDNFWIYWMITLPLTTIVLGV